MSGLSGSPDRFAGNDIIPHFARKGTALTQEERAAIAKRKGLCVRCGTKTHTISVFKRAPLTNENVYRGVCIKCNPTDVPREVLQDWEHRHPRLPVCVPEPEAKPVMNPVVPRDTTTTNPRPRQPTSEPNISKPVNGTGWVIPTTAFSYQGKGELITSKHAALSALQRDPFAFEYVSKKLRRNQKIQETLLDALQDPFVVGLHPVLPRASDALRSNKEFVLAAVKANGEEIQYAPKEWQSQQEVLLSALQTNPSALQYASSELLDDKKIILAAIRASRGSVDCHPIRNASHKLRANKAVVLEAIRVNGGESILHASKKLRSDKDILEAALQTYHLLLQNAPATMQSDREFVMAAVNADTRNFRYASEELRGDKEVALAAIGGKSARGINEAGGGSNLNYASKELQSDKEVVLEAVKSSAESLQFASEELRLDKDVILASFGTNPSLENVPKKLCSDKEVVLAAVQVKGTNLCYAPEELRSNKEVVLAAVKSSPDSFQYVSEELRADEEVVFMAMSHGEKREIFSMISDSFLWKKALVLSLLSPSSHSKSKESKFSNPSEEEIVELVKKSSFPFLVLVCEELRSKKAVVMAALSSPSYAIGGDVQHIPDDLLDNKHVAQAIVEYHDLEVLLQSKRLMSTKLVAMSLLERKATSVMFLPHRSEIEAILQKCSAQLRADKSVVLKAVTREGMALQYATGATWYDHDVVMAAVRQNGMALQYAPHHARACKEVVLAAVTSEPQSLKFALGGLNQERDCLIKAGLWDDLDQSVCSNKTSSIADMILQEAPQVPKVVLSTRFSLDAKSSPIATQFTLLFKQHPQVTGKFGVYSPNAWSKDTCDPDWTRKEWPCRGTFETCQKEDPGLKTGTPQAASCWRYSFRYQLEKAKESKGFMLQVIQLAEKRGPLVHEMGSGQEIESEMAAQVGVKVFRVYQPRRVGNPFNPLHVRSLMAAVNDWRGGGSGEDRVCEIFLQ